MAATKLKQFRAKRQLQLDLLDDLLNLSNSAVTDQSLHTRFKLSCAVLDEIYSEFEKVHASIISIIASSEDPDFTSDKETRKQFFQNFFTVKTIYENLFSKKVEGTENPVTSHTNNLKLKPLSIPIFSGDYKEWPAFKGLFCSLVHENSDLRPVEKFQYLVTFLAREPLRSVKTLPLTDENYVIAFRTLEERYENKRLLASAYWHSIYSLKPLASATPKGLRLLVDNFQENLSALETIQFPVDVKDFILFNILIQKLDPATRERFELELGHHNIPTLSILQQFLKKQCNALENVALISDKPSSSRVASPPDKYKPLSSLVAAAKHSLPRSKGASSRTTCTICREEHLSSQCSSLSDKTPEDRFKIIKDKNLCVNCFGTHLVRDCGSRFNCRLCNARHHTLLHFPRSAQTPSAPAEESRVPSPNLDNTNSSSNVNVAVPAHSLNNTTHYKQQVLLSTVQVEIKDNWGTFRPIRALIDTGSQVNVITNRCLQKLGLSSKTLSLSLFGIGQNTSPISKEVHCTIRPTGQTTSLFDVDAVVLPTICSDIPSTSVSIGKLDHLANLKLADPHFNRPGPVDLLLGAELFPLIIREGKLQANSLAALNTVFGWIVMGRTGTSSDQSTATSLFISSDHTIDSTLKRFWELEDIPNIPCMSPEDVQCETHFLKGYSRDFSGRFSVALPFSGPEPVLGDSKTGAMRQFFSLERRLKLDPYIYGKYSDLIREYLAHDYMELIESSSIDSSKVYYIPHHCVINSSSCSTPVRIVYNASFKTVEGNSLNDHLLVGPKLQKDIRSLLLNFRIHPFVFTADIKQMYLQIKVVPHHTDYQRILWRFSSEEPVREYRHKTVVFGATSSPYLAIRTLLQLAQEEGSNFPIAAKVIQTCTYVDDIITGCSSLQQALDLKQELISLLGKGHFELKKWSSNSSEFLQSIPASHRLSTSLSLSGKDEALVKVLGLKWFSQIDSFSYSVEPITKECTKRSILSELARIFDPLGFITPVTFLVKHLMQYLWTLGLDWDQRPPANVVELWSSLSSQLPDLSELQISRSFITTSWTDCQLHVFSDSSEKGYGGVVYFRFELPDGNVKVSLVSARSKVAPLKRVSLPRLELCAALLAAKLVDFVIQSCSESLSFSQIFAWSDSTVALSWIKSSPHRWKAFVSNRVSIIHDLISPSLWRHVDSKDNPADCVSRGLLPSELKNHTLYWNGPSWLTLPLTEWPAQVLGSIPDMSALKEERKIVLSTTVTLASLDLLLDKYSSLSKIKRIVAYVLRFTSRNKKVLTTGAFTKPELHRSLLVLVKRVQSVIFSDVISNLRSNKPVPKPYRKLNLFLSEDGVLRVGGRLIHSGLSYDQKHPALLPRDHRLTYLLIEDTHREYMHPGLQTLHFLLLQNFWVLSPKRAILHVLARCVKCFRTNPKSFQPQMGDLPGSRVNEAKPFQIVGVDFGGPFTITLGRVRAAKTFKAYLCLFVCFTTKALHLELASDLTSDCFIASLRRFVARRGRCSQIVSDRGTNFVGAQRQLTELMKAAAEAEGILWSFNPPSCPHFGGLWEAGIKSVKTRLMKVIGDQILTYEEFYTVLVQVEAILNSRPLCPISSDPDDLSVLTPGHFLTLEPLTCVPDPDLTTLPTNHLTRWQLLQRLQQDFWRRWKVEYLHTLQQRSKWFEADSRQVSEGLLVLIKDDQAPPLKWRLGRIIQLHPGPDGISRVATVKTSNGTVQRPLVKLCPLPVKS